MERSVQGLTTEQCFDKLVSFFGAKPTKEFALQFRKAMSKYSPEIIGRMYDHTTYQDERLQPLSVLIAYCNHFLEEKSDEQKKAEKKAIDRGVYGGDDKGKQVMEIVRQLMTGFITRQQYIDKLRAIGIEPGLDEWYEKMGYDKNDKCRMAKMARV